LSWRIVASGGNDHPEIGHLRIQPIAVRQPDALYARPLLEHIGDVPAAVASVVQRVNWLNFQHVGTGIHHLETLVGTGRDSAKYISLPKQRARRMDLASAMWEPVGREVILEKPPTLTVGAIALPAPVVRDMVVVATSWLKANLPALAGTGNAALEHQGWSVARNATYIIRHRVNADGTVCICPDQQMIGASLDNPVGGRGGGSQNGDKLPGQLGVGLAFVSPCLISLVAVKQAICLLRKNRLGGNRHAAPRLGTRGLGRRPVQEPPIRTAGLPPCTGIARKRR
jgi:hypothetical protein